MPRLLVDAPGLVEPAQIELLAGGSVLIGRDPDDTQLEVDPALPEGGAHASVRVSSPSVSANHALVRLESTRVAVHDLGSRNGTWVRVPSKGVIEVESAAEVGLQLAGAQGRSPAETEPDEPRYAGREDYGDAIVASVSRWLTQRGVRARVGASRLGARAEPSHIARFVLASDAQLWVAVDHTVDAGTERMLERLRPWIARQNVTFLAEDETRAEGTILASRAIRVAHQTVVDGARRGIPNLVLLGPSGAGKERLARTFHRNTGRGGPFVAINCSMLDRNLARADLFGADVGAYTGAVRTRVGAVERAHGGTLFLDEIADMPSEVQPVLLRFLDQGGEFERMGGDGRPRHSDVRIVCATNKDLREASHQGSFRSDLWWRLSVQVVEVPPLRDRFEDVLAYLRTRRIGDRFAIDALQPSALEVLRQHSWEGNFRELTNLVTRLSPDIDSGDVSPIAVRRAIAAGALVPLEESRSPPLARSADGAEDWSAIAASAAHAFAEDHGRDAPDSWADVGTFVEQYLKPVAVQRMIEVLGEDGAVPQQKLAQRLQVDAKTVSKHLRRYAERFTR